MSKQSGPERVTSGRRGMVWRAALRRAWRFIITYPKKKGQIEISGLRQLGVRLLVLSVRQKPFSCASISKCCFVGSQCHSSVPLQVCVCKNEHIHSLSLLSLNYALSSHHPPYAVMGCRQRSTSLACDRCTFSTHSDPGELHGFKKVQSACSHGRRINHGA